MRVNSFAFFGIVTGLLLNSLVSAQEPQAQIGYATSVPVLDGLDDDDIWSTAETYSNFEVAGGTVDGDADLFTVWKALWDEDNLYAHVQVVDDSIQDYGDDPTFSDWNSDSVEFYLDANLNGFTHSLLNPGTPYDYQNEFAGEPVYQLTIMNNQLELHEGVNHVEYLARNGDDSNLDAGWQQTDSSYSLEIAFPWEALGSDPDTIFGQDGIFGLGIAINDEDDGAERDAQGMWATSDGSLWHDATMFPLVQLDPKGDDPPPPSLPGDANGDGIVNATDLNIVGGNWQMAVDPAGPENGDFDSNGFVDAADLNVIGTNWQRTAAPEGAAVPEPTGLCLLGLGALALSQLRRRNS